MGSTQVCWLNDLEQTMINNNKKMKPDPRPRRVSKIFFSDLCYCMENTENLPLSFSDVMKEYSKTSHSISKETPGMEKAMTEYIAYKLGKRGDPVAHLKGANHFHSRSNKGYT